MIQEYLLNHTQALYPTIIFIENQHTYVKQRSKMIMRTNEGLPPPPPPSLRVFLVGGWLRVAWRRSQMFLE